jgi:hypothetical protein
MARWNSVILAATVCAACAVSPAVAENVPLPTPAPLPKTGVAPPPASAPTEAAPSTPSTSFFPFTLPFGKGLPSEASKFDAKQQNLLDRISLYLSSVQTLVGTFVPAALGRGAAGAASARAAGVPLLRLRGG